MGGLFGNVVLKSMSLVQAAFRTLARILVRLLDLRLSRDNIGVNKLILCHWGRASGFFSLYSLTLIIALFKLLRNVVYCSFKLLTWESCHHINLYGCVASEGEGD